MNPRIPRLIHPARQLYATTISGIIAPADITPNELPASMKAKLVPRRLSLVHLWAKAMTGAQHAEHPAPAKAKNKLACNSEVGYAISKAPPPIRATKMASIILTLYLSDKKPNMGERTV